MARFDLRVYLRTQQQETYRACIIHGPPMGHKTALARRMRDVLGAHLLDLQARFAADAELAARIDRFRPRDLETLLLELEASPAIVVVDNCDFLLNTWSNARRQEFLVMVERRLKSPGLTDKTFVFMLQTDGALTSQEMLNSRRQPRVLRLDMFHAL